MTTLDFISIPTATDLAAQLTGSVVTPDDPAWDDARRAWNLNVDQRPDLVVWAETTDDLVAVARHAALTGQRIATQSTGHGSPAMGSLAGAILLKTSRMKRFAIDPAARRVRVEPGVLWEEVTPALAEHGLAALTGSAGDIGIVGYSLGGGIGWLGRRYGIACNSVLAADVVTAEGEIIRVDADHHPELFWALRGGGGSFGIVAALEFAVYPVRDVHAGMLLWPVERAREVLQAWRRWTLDLPDSVTSIGRILHFPPLPDLPPFLSGRSIVVIEAAFLEGEAHAAALLAELRALEPEVDTFATVTPPALAQLHMDPPQPVPGDGDHLLLAELPPEAIDAVVGAVGPESGSSLLSMELRHFGGALGVADPGHGALDHVEAPYMMFAVGLPVTPEAAAAITADLAAVRTSLAPWDAGREYLNLAEQPTSAQRVFGSALERLLAVRHAYDPAGRFQANHPVKA